MLNTRKLKENLPSLAASLIIAAAFAAVAYFCFASINPVIADGENYGPRTARETRGAAFYIGIIAIAASLVSLAFLFITAWIFADCLRNKTANRLKDFLQDLVPPR